MMDWRSLRSAVERTHPATLADSAEAYGRRVLIFDTAKLLLSWVVECDNCRGKGTVTVQTSLGPMITDDVMCRPCSGRGWTPDPATVEKVANAIYDLPYDHLELRDWGEESVADPAKVIAEAVLLALLEPEGER